MARAEDFAEIYCILESIGEDGSRDHKQDILRNYADDPLLRNVLYYAYNPYLTYNLRNIQPWYTGTGTIATPDHEFFTYLDEMAAGRLRGDTASTCIIQCLHEMNQGTQIVMKRMLQRDLRCGVSAKTINKAIPGLIPTFDVMLASEFDQKRLEQWETPYYVEPKLDGMRVLIHWDGSHVQCFSRTGKPVNTLSHVEHTLRRIPCIYPHGAILDGEVMSASFLETMSSVRRKSGTADDAVLWVFDVMPAGVFQDQAKTDPYYKRRETLVELEKYFQYEDPIRRVPVEFANTYEGIDEIYQKFRSQGLEGAIVKPRDHRYEFKRSKNWLKLKAKNTLDLRVKDVFEGTGKYVDRLGGVSVYYGNTTVNVGSGFSDTQRQYFWEHPNEIIGQIVEVEYHEITRDSSLRHPRFKGIRHDKEEPDT